MLVIKLKNKEIKFRIYISKDSKRIMLWYLIKEDKCTATVEMYLNPMYRIWNRIKYYSLIAYLTLTNQMHLLCWGCGEGIIKYSIKDPNKKTNTRKYWKVCEKCVMFYDFHWSAKKIKK